MVKNTWRWGKFCGIVPLPIIWSYMDEEKKIKAKLSGLMDEHRALDDKIANSPLNMLEIQRLKRQKLVLKDEIAKLNAMLYSDIIA